ncbi:MAG: hypothetical protein ACJ07L_15925, partial [Opitutales bacterium]
LGAAFVATFFAAFLAGAFLAAFLVAFSMIIFCLMLMGGRVNVRSTGTRYLLKAGLLPLFIQITIISSDLFVTFL